MLVRLGCPCSTGWVTLPIIAVLVILARGLEEPDDQECPAEPAAVNGGVAAVPDALVAVPPGIALAPEQPAAPPAAARGAHRRLVVPPRLAAMDPLAWPMQLIIPLVWSSTSAMVPPLPVRYGCLEAGW